MTVLAAVSGAAIMAGLLLMVLAAVGTRAEPAPIRPAGSWQQAWARRRRTLAGPAAYRRAAVQLTAPLLALLITGWPVAALLAGAAAVGLPRMLTAKHDAAGQIARLEALADWTRRLADVLGAGAGLEHALEASLRTVPAAVGPQVTALVARLRARRPIEAALRAFADDLNDPTGDLVVAALLLAAHRRGRGLARILTGLAATVDAEVGMRRGVEADRAQPRTTARWVVYITVAVAGGLLVFDRGYVAPFGTVGGQLALLVVGGLFAAAFGWMHQLTAAAPGGRFLPKDPEFRKTEGFTTDLPARAAAPLGGR